MKLIKAIQFRETLAYRLFFESGSNFRTEDKEPPPYAKFRFELNFVKRVEF